MSKIFHRDRFTWLAYFLFAYYCLFLNILGPITPYLKSELHLSYTVSSLHFSALAVGILISGLNSHFVIQRVGWWKSLWIGAFGISASALALIAGKSPVITIPACFLIGLLGSLILIIIPPTLSDQHGEHRAVALAEMTVTVSLACTLAPLLVGWSARLPVGWRLAIGVSALTPFALWLFFGKAALPQTNSNQPTPSSSSKRLPVLFWAYWFGIVLSVAVEFCMISWSADYLENILGMLKINAVQAVSLFLGGMILGRIAGSRLVLRFRSRDLTVAFILLAGIGFALFWTAHSVWLGLLGLFITGLGIASLYPLILSMAMEAARENTSQAGAMTTLASGVAILTLPLLLGRLADLTDIWKAYGVVVVLLVALLTIILATGRKKIARSVIQKG